MEIIFLIMDSIARYFGQIRAGTPVSAEIGEYVLPRVSGVIEVAGRFESSHMFQL